MIGWDKSFAMGITQVDEQHKQLFEIIAELHQAMLKRQTNQVIELTLNKLVSYTANHFKSEEDMLRRLNYQDLGRHKLIHDEFTAQIKKYLKQHKEGGFSVNVELMNTLQKWLVEHIKGTDMKYARDLKLVS